MKNLYAINVIKELSCGYKRHVDCFDYTFFMIFWSFLDTTSWSLLIVMIARAAWVCLDTILKWSFGTFNQHLPDSCRYLYTRKLTSSLLILIFTPAYTMRSAHRTQAWERKDTNNIRKPSHRMTLKTTTEEVWILLGFLPSTQGTRSVYI